MASRAENEAFKGGKSTSVDVKHKHTEALSSCFRTSPSRLPSYISLNLCAESLAKNTQKPESSEKFAGNETSGVFTDKKELVS